MNSQDLTALQIKRPRNECEPVSNPYYGERGLRTADGQLVFSARFCWPRKGVLIGSVYTYVSGRTGLTRCLLERTVVDAALPRAERQRVLTALCDLVAIRLGVGYVHVSEPPKGGWK